MAPLSLPGRVRATIDIDLCFPCQGIWFDSFESLQLAPEGIIELFRLLGSHRDDPRRPRAPTVSCPRCAQVLLETRDLVKSGRFIYHRCPGGHGRFVGFAQFMIEKGFVRELNDVEIARLKAQIGVVRCASCGAPVDIRQDAVCGHCGSPLAILDPAAVDKALANYGQAAGKRAFADATGLVDVILSQERERARSSLPEAGVAANIVAAGVDLVWSFLLGG